MDPLATSGFRLNPGSNGQLRRPSGLSQKFVRALARRTHPFLTERGRELGARRRRLRVVLCGRLRDAGEDARARCVCRSELASAKLGWSTSRFAGSAFSPGWEAPSRQLEELDRVAGRIFEQDLTSAPASDNLVAKAHPRLRRASTSSARLSTSSWIRFQPPGSGSRPSGIASPAPPLPGALSSRRSSPRDNIANPEPGSSRP
jgi:hypothetical protein